MSGTAVIDPVARAMHDQMLAQLPPGATHDRASCEMCMSDEPKPLEDRMPEISEQDVQNRIDAAVAQYQARISELDAALAELRESQSAAAQEARIAEVRQPLEDRIAELETEVELRTNERDAAVRTNEEVAAYLGEVAAENQRAEEAAAVRDERVERVREVASFADDFYTETRMDRWATMPAEEFDAYVEELAATSGGAPRRNGDVPPAGAFRGRETAAAGAAGARTSHIREALSRRHEIRRS